jgi:hypothetical protein
MIPWATALCQQHPENFDEFIRKSPAVFGHIFKSQRQPAYSPVAFRDSRESSAELESICSQLGLDPSRLAP